MNTIRNIIQSLRRPTCIVVIIMLITAVTLISFSLYLTTASPVKLDVSAPSLQKTTQLITSTFDSTIVPSPSPQTLPPQRPENILGVDVGSIFTEEYIDIPWVRISHPSCGWGKLRGKELRNVVQSYHRNNVRVLLTLCQSNKMSDKEVTAIFKDVAQGYPDAVQCGNEQMKQDASVPFLYMSPERFAGFYDRCDREIHAINPQAVTLMGSLDPLVAGPDVAKMNGQVQYFEQMQRAMNTKIRPGSNWEWRKQAVGVIDSWYNGYRGANNLAGVFDFWAQQFGTPRDSGALGRHLWVVEGTGCFKGCGLNEQDEAEIAIAHILTLITDVDTSMRARVPFFFFSGRDFYDAGVYWPIGLLDAQGRPKPLRQDLSMGARTLILSCPDGSKPVVSHQLGLLARMYARCTLPANYAAVLTA